MQAVSVCVNCFFFCFIFIFCGFCADRVPNGVLECYYEKMHSVTDCTQRLNPVDISDIDGNLTQCLCYVFKSF